MKLEHAFEVPASPEATLKLLLDAERVVPCMPGAQLTEVVDDRHWKAKMTVKLGPVGMDFLNAVTLAEVDEANGHVHMQATGRDTRGKGGASAEIDARFVQIEGGTRVEMSTDMHFSGQAAQLGRPSVVQDVSSKLLGQFAECLKGQLAAATPEEAADAVQKAQEQKHIFGLSLIIAAISGAIGRLFGRKPKTPQGGSA